MAWTPEKTGGFILLYVFVYQENFIIHSCHKSSDNHARYFPQEKASSAAIYISRHQHNSLLDAIVYTPSPDSGHNGFSVCIPLPNLHRVWRDGPQQFLWGLGELRSERGVSAEGRREGEVGGVVEHAVEVV